MNASLASACVNVAVQAIGIGVDTARYGHYVSFLHWDADSGNLLTSAKAFAFTESSTGYRQLQQAIERLAKRFPNAELLVRLDLAGQYGINLETFLRNLPLPLKLSTGDPLRNQNYRAAIFPKEKSDPAESYSMARFALVERPGSTEPLPVTIREMREIASQLLASTQDQTTHVNQLHNLLARVFPELTATFSNLRRGWLLAVLKRYPTPDHLRRAKLDSMLKIRYLTEKNAKILRDIASQSVGSFSGAIAAKLVRELVTCLHHDATRKRRLEKMLVELYRQLPTNYLATIPGIGEVTAAILTARIASMDRFSSPAKLVSYFGVFPEVRQSGCEPSGQRKQGKAGGMSTKGNDLVRAYLFSCACSACRINPACQPLYVRKKEKGLASKAALGHVMHKLLHLVYAIWKTNKPFDVTRYPTEAKEKDAASPKVKMRPERLASNGQK
jgi:transposase